MSDKPPKEWVAGFLFLNNSVALIRKARPEWQRGKLNGVGGKVEKGETPHKAMDREWSEETEAPSQIWFKFSTLDWSGGRVHFFAARTEKAPWSFRRDTDERVEWYAVEETTFAQAIPNLRWLIPMALDKDNVIAQVHEPGTAWNHLAAHTEAGKGEAFDVAKFAKLDTGLPCPHGCPSGAPECGLCADEGTEHKDEEGTCPECKGKGTILNEYNRCPACHGTGTAGEGEGGA